MSQHPDELSSIETDFLTPEQRLDIVADILATIALRVIKQNHETNPLN